MTITLGPDDIQRMIHNYLTENHINREPKLVLYEEDEGHGHTKTVDVDRIVIVLD